MNRLRLKSHLSYANVVATVALAVAVAGIPTAVAITKASKKSDVNKKGNIRAGRVTFREDRRRQRYSIEAGRNRVIQASGSVGSAEAKCPAGERLIGGGGRASSGTSTLSLSMPQAATTGGTSAPLGGGSVRQLPYVCERRARAWMS